MIFGYLGAIPFYAFLTKSGSKWRNNVKSYLNSSSQTQIKKTTRKKQICSSCGWQNSQENNFCHDCGTELGD
ncbi:zinc-ribbon domain-containing protein [Haloplanus salinarum]